MNSLRPRSNEREKGNRSEYKSKDDKSRERSEGQTRSKSRFSTINRSTGIASSGPGKKEYRFEAITVSTDSEKFFQQEELREEEKSLR